MPGGGRGHYPVEMHTVSVGEPLDITAVKVSATEVKLKPGESQKIEITIERAEGFDKNVTLDCLYRHLNSVYGDSLPKGVTIDMKREQDAADRQASRPATSRSWPPRTPSRSSGSRSP